MDGAEAAEWRGQPAGTSNVDFGCWGVLANFQQLQIVTRGVYNGLSLTCSLRGYVFEEISVGCPRTRGDPVVDSGFAKPQNADRRCNRREWIVARARGFAAALAVSG